MSATARIVTWQRTAAVELIAADTRVMVVPELGMVLGAFVVDGFDHVARPGGITALRGNHTTAVPLLHPWANRLSRRRFTAAGTEVSLRGLPLHTDEHGLPIHGVLVGHPGWEITALGRGRVTAWFDFGAHPELLAAFPFPHSLTVTVRVTRRTVRVETTVHADQGVAVPVSFGWHPYWRVPGARVDWHLALPEVAHERLDRRGIPTGRARSEAAAVAPLADRAFDDLYALAETRTFELRGDGPRLRVAFDDGYPFAQVYSPIGADFCCVEPMTAPTNALVTGDHPVVRAGDHFTASFRADVGR